MAFGVHWHPETYLPWTTKYGCGSVHCLCTVVLLHKESEVREQKGCVLLASTLYPLADRNPIVKLYFKYEHIRGRYLIYFDGTSRGVCSHFVLFRRFKTSQMLSTPKASSMLCPVSI